MTIWIVAWVTCVMFAGGFSEIGETSQYRFEWGVFPVLSLFLTPGLGIIGISLEDYEETAMKWGFIVFGCLLPNAALGFVLYGARDMIFG